MIPQINQYVILVLRDSGVRLDGTVIEWNDKIVLQSATSITIVIPNIADVLYYQIISSNDKYEEIKAKPIKGPEDIQELAKLKSELNLLERQEIARKFSTHEISGNAKLTTYELPIFAKIPVAKHDTGTKTPKSDTKFDTGLQGLFQQKQR